MNAVYELGIPICFSYRVLDESLSVLGTDISYIIFLMLTKHFQHSLKAGIRVSATAGFCLDGANLIECTIPAIAPSGSLNLLSIVSSISSLPLIVILR